MRCPACSARNAAGAAWCTQCYADLRGPTGEVNDPPEGSGRRPAGPASDPASDPDTAPSDPAPERTPSDGATRDVRTVHGEVQWRCSTCGSWSPLDASACVACGAARRGFGELAPPPALGPSARGKLVLASAALPGLGHLLAGRLGTGLARAILALTWGLGVFVLLRGAGRGAGLVPVVPLLLGLAVLWAGSLRDTLALVDGGDELLRPRVLTWLAGGVLATVVLAVILVAAGSSPTP